MHDGLYHCGIVCDMISFVSSPLNPLAFKHPSMEYSHRQGGGNRALRRMAVSELELDADVRDVINPRLLPHNRYVCICGVQCVFSAGKTVLACVCIWYADIH